MSFGFMDSRNVGEEQDQNNALPGFWITAAAQRIAKFAGINQKIRVVARCSGA